MKKPFDRRLPSLLAKVAKTFFIPFNPLLCYIFSDGANFLFLQPSAFRRIEKIDSVFAGLSSSYFTKLAKIPDALDCRVIPIGKRNIAKYLVWRQAECWRNHNNAWAQ